MPKKLPDKQKAAEEWTQATHGLSLRDYLRREINRHRSDTQIGKDFGVHRHTIRDWRKKTGLKKVTKAILA